MFNLNKPILQEMWDGDFTIINSCASKNKESSLLEELNDIKKEYQEYQEDKEELLEELLKDELEDEIEDINDNLNDIDSSFYETIHSQENILNLLLKLQKNKNPESILKNIKILKNNFEKLEENYEKFNDFMKKIKNIESSLQENKKIEEKKKVLKKVKID